MNKTLTSLVFLAIVVLSLPLYAKSETFVPYLEMIGYIPGNTYDLGTLSETDVLKVSMNWVML